MQIAFIKNFKENGFWRELLQAFNVSPPRHQSTNNNNQATAVFFASCLSRSYLMQAWETLVRYVTAIKTEKKTYI